MSTGRVRTAQMELPSTADVFVLPEEVEDNTEP